MAKLSLDLSQFKAAGVYTVEIDNSERIVVSSQSLRLVVGFSEVGPQNTPVFITSKEDLRKFYGSSDPKLERKGSFFHRMIETCLQTSPVFAISLLAVDTKTNNNTDNVDICMMSLSCNENNPIISEETGNITKTPYYTLFNRSRFWTPDAEYLQSQSAIVSSASSEYNAPLFQICNIGTKTVTLFAFKPNNLTGYNVFAKDWYGSESKIPYSWINPYDKISDYFIQIYAIEGEWNNYNTLSVDPIWSTYFNSDGIKKDKLVSFLNMSNVNLIGSWTGSIIPDFRDKMDSLQYIEPIVNSSVSLTGILMNINNEAFDELDADPTSVEHKVDLTGSTIKAVDGKVKVDMLSYNIDVNESEFYNIFSDVLDCGIKDQSAANGTTLMFRDKIVDNKTITININDLIEGKDGLAYVTNKLWVSGDTGINSQYIVEGGSIPKEGAWVITTSIPVKFTDIVSTAEENVKAGGQVKTSHTIKVQKNINDDSISKTYKAFVIKGLELKKRHLPGYDETGSMSVESGVSKIYGMLQDNGINRGLTNPDMISYRYIVDTMAYGLRPNMGGKAYVSKLAKQRGKTTAILNAPSISQFAKSQDPYFCDTFVAGASKPIFNTKWIGEGGNPNMQRSFKFTMPDEDFGAKYCGVFGPFLKYSDNGKTILVPPAADVSNAYVRKFMGGDPYAIVANKNGLISNPNVTGLEYVLDNTDREYLEPIGYNSIIEKPRSGEIMIYSNGTSFQTIKSDFNYLHVRELLNTIEIECAEALSNYVFEKHTPVMRLNVINTLTPKLETMKDAGALYDYEIIMDSSNNTDEIIDEGVGVVDIGVWITKGMQKIIQRISVNNLSGSSY
ncbi:MAG: hypothetical protein RSE41_03880 [Clostridia bacterium]